MSLLALLTACQPDIHFVDNSFHSSSAELVSGGENLSVLFTSSAGKATVEFESNKDWTVAFVNDRAKDWCSFSEESGKKGTYTLTFSVKQNDTYDERSASIVLTCKDVTRTLVVTQKQKDALLMTAGRIEIPQPGGNFQIEVQANIDYTATVDGDCDWIHATGTKGLKTTVNTFVVDANETVDPRQGYVVVSSSLGKESVTVYQPGEDPTLIVSSHEASFGPEGGSFDVQVTSNLDVEVVMPEDCDWISEVSTKTISTNTYYYTVAPNETRSTRTASIIYRNRKFSMTDTVHVRQECPVILISDSVWSVPSRSVNLKLQVYETDPADYQVDLPSKWIEWTGSLQEEDGLWLLFRVLDNNTTKARSMKFGIYRKGITKPDVVKVDQMEKQPSFSYVTARQDETAPELGKAAKDAWIHWGDGVYERWKAGLTHHYDAAGQHTVLVEGKTIYELRIVPENGMRVQLKDIQ